MSNNTLFYRRIDIHNPPTETVIATDFEDDPVIGIIKIKNGRAYCELPYRNLDDGSYYNEQVTHYVTLHDFNHGIDTIND
jgi:hypothetical protein